MNPRLEITGLEPNWPYRSRFVCRYQNKEVLVERRCFEYLVKLAVARQSRPDGWIRKEEIEPGVNQARYIYRLKMEFRRQGALLEIENIVKSGRPHKGRLKQSDMGRYRLGIAPHEIRIQWGQLIHYDDAAISGLANENVRRRPA